MHTEPLGIVLLLVNMLFAMADRLVQRLFLAVHPLDISKTGALLLNNAFQSSDCERYPLADAQLADVGSRAICSSTGVGGRPGTPTHPLI